MAKKVITKEMILKAAFELLRKEGATALSVRSIAHSCDCSTQPIYLSFKGIDEIKDEICKIAMEYFYEYLLKMVAEKKYPEYKAMGMAYVKFAHDEPELFKYVFMTKPRIKYDSVDASFETSVSVIKRNLNISNEAARKLHLEMWIFGHGIATMYITNYIDFDLDTVSEMYKDVYTGIIKNLGGSNDN
ncbi:MAG: WHG domain-containing protein [Clostridia bacterium]|nr:WHG domain-containing protein [Clostridia bacterium]